MHIFFSSFAAKHMTDEQVTMLGAIGAPRARMSANFSALLVHVSIQRSFLRINPPASCTSEAPASRALVAII